MKQFFIMFLFSLCKLGKKLRDVLKKKIFYYNWHFLPMKQRKRVKCLKI